MDTLPNHSLTVSDNTAFSPTARQVQWCLHTLFYMLCNNEANQEEALRYPTFEVVQYCVHISCCQTSHYCTGWYRERPQPKLGWMEVQ